LKMDPVKGESRDKTHKDEMDVLAYSFGMSQSGTTHVGGGGGSGKVNVQDLSITKYIDKASCDLMLACCNGKHFDKAVLVVRKAGEQPVEYLTMTMEEVLISAVSTGGSGGEDRLTENVTLNFAKFQIEYKEQDPKGAGKPAGNMTWNIAENTK
jgi:type VI secretion system secreted protein Hcp